jgi:pimeloyl-ACP methyl ester carboxylesterase
MKLRVLLIHGTWGSSSAWKEQGSEFRKWLASGLSAKYSSIEVIPIEWSGNQRWRARDQATTRVNEELERLHNGAEVNIEYLVIGHSHGGNIATEAVRRRMAVDPKFPIKGVVCLNTPFLKTELRASSSFLGVWLYVVILVGAALALAATIASPSTVAALAMIESIFKREVNSNFLLFLLFALAALMASVTILNRNLLRDHEHEEFVWGPRPPVLCLSCADDEAITFLGFFEGVANFPQLLFHPVALLVAISTTAAFLGLHPEVRFCPNELACWTSGTLAVGIGLAAWTAIALFGGVLGSLLISWIFGLDRRMFLESLVSRVLVSYVPLKPANSSFRAIVDMQSHWTPAQLLHSRIYQSKSAIDEMCQWIVKHSPRS